MSAFVATDPPAQAARRVLLLINHASRRGEVHADQAADLLGSAGLTLVRPDFEDPATLADLVRAHRDQADLVVVGGGDGSLNLALPGVLEAGLPLGVLPLGTANNFARNLGVPLDLPGACQVIAAGATRQIDVADVNGHPFLNVTGMGLSTEINRRLTPEFKRRWGLLAYVIHCFKIARRMRPFHADIVVDDQPPERVRSFQITVCNGRHYGTGMSIAQEATIDDGRLDLCSIEIDVWWKGFLLLGALKRGTPERKADLRWLYGSRIEIRTHRPLRIDADGELVARTPAVFRVHPQRLTVFAPAQAPESSPGK